MPISKPLSIYLDILRVLAAFAVLFKHMDMDGVSMSWLFLSQFSREGVIIFFVLSGYIIHATTTAGGRTAKEYCIARASRIYSVAIPAIVFSVLLAWTLPYAGLEVTALPNWAETDILSLASAVLFLNESWGNPAALTLNNPYWSLCYEVWYYALFGIALYTCGSVRWMLLTVAGLIAGPAIMMLFPVWLLGAALSKYGNGIVLSQKLAAVLFIGTLAAIGTIGMMNLGTVVQNKMTAVVPVMWWLGSSQQFVVDYLLAVLVAVNILAFKSLGDTVHTLLRPIERPIQYIAGFSFSLYLFHRPLTQLAGDIAPSGEGAVLHGLVVAVIISIICLALSYLSERRTGQWRILMHQLWTRATTPRGRVALP